MVELLSVGLGFMLPIERFLKAEIRGKIG